MTQWIVLVFALLTLSACAITTTYGRAPRQSPTDPTVFNFTVYRNSFSTAEDTDRKAAEEFVSFAAENGFVAWRVIDRSCQNLLTNKCDYQTRFFKSEEDLARFDGEPVGAVPTEPEHPAITGPSQSSGTAFLVNEVGNAVTNAHVVDGCDRITVAGQTATLLRADPVNDLAVLSTSLTGPYTRIRTAGSVRPGEGIMAVGFPLRGLLASEPLVTYGTVTATAGLGDDTRFLQVSAEIQPGNSGGPLLDQGGSVVGVVTSKLNVISVLKVTDDIPQNVNFAVKSELLSVFLTSSRVGFERGEATKSLSNVDLAQVGMDVTHPIVCYRH